MEVYSLAEFNIRKNNNIHGIFGMHIYFIMMVIIVEEFLLTFRVKCYVERISDEFTKNTLPFPIFSLFSGIM